MSSNESEWMFKSRSQPSAMVGSYSHQLVYHDLLGRETNEIDSCLTDLSPRQYFFFILMYEDFLSTSHRNYLWDMYAAPGRLRWTLKRIHAVHGFPMSRTSRGHDVLYSSIPRTLEINDIINLRHIIVNRHVYNERPLRYWNGKEIVWDRIIDRDI